MRKEFFKKSTVLMLTGVMAATLAGCRSSAGGNEITTKGVGGK